MPTIQVHIIGSNVIKLTRGVTALYAILPAITIYATAFGPVQFAQTYANQILRNIIPLFFGVFFGVLKEYDHPAVSTLRQSRKR